MLKFIKGAYDEFQLIQWPSKDETIHLTAYVIGASFSVGLLVLGFDFLFSKSLTLLLTK